MTRSKRSRKKKTKHATSSPSSEQTKAVPQPSQPPEKAEQELRESEERFRLLIEGVQDCALFMLDPEGHIASWNAGAEQIFGFSAGEVMGRDVSLLYTPEARESGHPQRGLELAASQGRHKEEGQRLRKDGSRFWADVVITALRDENGKLRGFAWVTRDITERQQAEQALREREARLRAILDTAVDAIIIIDERGIIESVNPAAERMFGYTAGEMIGQNIKMLMPSPYREEHDGYLARYLRTGVKRIIGIGREVQARRKEGSTLPVNLSVSEFHRQSQRFFCGIHHDLSARKALEREVLEAARMEQWRIGQELHDRTGQELTALGLLAEGLVEALRKRSPDQAVLAAKIAEEVKQVLGQVRDLSRVLIPVEVDATGFMAALAELASRTSELHRVTCTFDCKQPVLVKDNQTATHLYLIAREAVTNALKHSQAKNIAISLEDDGQFIVLRIRDDGVGFPHEAVETRGMGLKIMRYRANLVNAQLAVERAEPVGTLVTCKLTRGASDDQEQEERT